MGKPLRALIVEDSEDDTLLLLRELRRGGYDVTHRRVETCEALRAALAGEAWDVVLSDYRLPHFSAPEALQVLKDSGLDLPFIILSGTVGEETAVASMKAGAHDYLLKGNLTRLCAAVEREVREADVRLARRQAEEALRRHAERLKVLHEIDRAILAAESPQEIADTALQHIRRLVSCQRASIALDDSEGGMATLLAVDTDGETRLGAGMRFPLSEFRSPETLRQGQVILIEDIRDLPEASPALRVLLAEGIVALMNVPLIARGDLIGVLNVGASRPGVFSSEDREVVREVADQLAIAIQQARLHAAVQHHAAELEARVQERTRELAAANRQLQEASRRKSEFLANMSHELRTPLNSIIGFAELLLGQSHGPLTERQARYLGHIHGGGKHLLQLISDILDISKVEAGKFVLQPESLPVAQTLEDILAIGRGLATKKGQTVTAEIEPSLPPLHADPVRFKQILFNLLSNAVKFTPERGTITLTARQVTDDRRPETDPVPRPRSPVPCLEIRVTDTGIGIRAEDLPRLFQEFVQLETPQAQKHEGTGLGLALTKRLVELYGGRIWAESAGAGKGSAFTILLPLAGPPGSRHEGQA